MQAPWWWAKTETCRIDIYVYHKVNFNVFFKIEKCFCGWANSTYIKMHGATIKKCIMLIGIEECCMTYPIVVPFKTSAWPSSISAISSSVRSLFTSSWIISSLGSFASCSTDGGCDSSAGCCAEIVVSGLSAATENKWNVLTWYSREKHGLKVPWEHETKGNIWT